MQFCGQDNKTSNGVFNLNEVIPLCTYYIMLYYIFPSTQLTSY